VKVTILTEPDLEFAYGGRHSDPRHGIDFFGPADMLDAHISTVRVGVVGTQESIDGVKRWLETCTKEIPAKTSHLGHLYVPFPGFNAERTFHSVIETSPRLERTIAKRHLDKLEGVNPLNATQSAVDLYVAELKVLDEERTCDIVLICRPEKLVDTGTRSTRRKDSDDGDATGATMSGPNPAGQGDFHSLLKAAALQFRQPLQIIKRSTWDPGFREPKDAQVRRKQDHATIAWNLHTALYYKAGGVPWRLPRYSGEKSSCYVGVSFYPGANPDRMETSVAQVFNQRGDGVIVRGAPARVSHTDRQPHLTDGDARDLLNDALTRYRSEHSQNPARLVLHKTSSFTEAEAAGFHAAADDHHIPVLELIWITRSESARLFRRGEQPALRGTLLSLDEKQHALYTRGATPFYRVYNGPYIPRPIGLRLHSTESSPEALASEILALTKMNWNATNLDGADPITLRTAARVGDILRHLGPDVSPQASYAFYM
jgi:hypothetical protein